MSNWSSTQRHVAFASFASWSLDAFDFFILVFVLSDLAKNFHNSISDVAVTIMLTLAVRPIGALIFGRLAEKFGRRPILMSNIILFSVFELLSAWSPSFEAFMAFRILYGIAMGGIWGVASALAMETIPSKSRGFMSGLFQAGYPAGYLLASIIFGLFYTHVGWRGMFVIGALPILMLPYIYFKVPESPVWLANQVVKERVSIIGTIKDNWRVCGFMVLLMTCFNFFSHGSQDLYPTFLKVQHGFDAHTVSIIAICYNISAIFGGIFFGSLSERIGRKKAIMIAALLALPVIPLWAFSTGSVSIGIGAFLMQFMVQGAWGVVPTYLNELVPANVRAILPSFVYQMGNLLASVNATIQTHIASAHDGHYSLAMAIVVGTVALLIAILVSRGKETRGVSMTADGVKVSA
ncbi:Putative sialic acid transporter [Marinomonas spartinae]|uniref:Putative sialic acid transporter n=1 Tax=Marinomonas spartinae TaxID=1792290 RepID=A0A1A8TS44_9GAMM|nr:MFS transporter [Marinomonas spartinae]SBS37430.1 Putative sialic acid transporter [Marinomonas spartinae]SBS37468.1 Putative sialic acid transporter [Marinomonas spartinae]